MLYTRPGSTLARRFIAQCASETVGTICSTHRFPLLKVQAPGSIFVVVFVATSYRNAVNEKLTALVGGEVDRRAVAGEPDVVRAVERVASVGTGQVEEGAVAQPLDRLAERHQVTVVGDAVRRSPSERAGHRGGGAGLPVVPPEGGGAGRQHQCEAAVGRDREQAVGGPVVAG